MRWLGGLLGSRRGMRKGKQRHELRRGLRYDARCPQTGVQLFTRPILILYMQECGPHFDFFCGFIQWDCRLQGLWAIDLWGRGSSSTHEDNFWKYAVRRIPRRHPRSLERSEWSGQATSRDRKDEMGVFPIGVGGSRYFVGNTWYTTCQYTFNIIDMYANHWCLL